MPSTALTNLVAWWDMQPQPSALFPLTIASRTADGTSYHELAQPFGTVTTGSFAGKGIAAFPLSPTRIDLLALGQSSSLRGKSALSLSFWMKLADGQIKPAPGKITPNEITLLAYNNLAGEIPNFEWSAVRSGNSTRFFLDQGNRTNSVHYFAIGAHDSPGFIDDGRWHHYALVIAGNNTRMYLDGVQIGPVSGNLNGFSVPTNSHTTGGYLMIGGTYAFQGPAKIQKNDLIGEIDGIMLNHGRLDSADPLVFRKIYRRDRDNDGLWDITETNTTKWTDHNGNAIQEPGEYTFTADPSVWDPSATDHDTDGLTSLDEQNITETLIDNPDTDGDSLPDGFEDAHPPLDPLVPDDSSADPDGDGLTTAEEYVGGTDPNVADAHLFPPTWTSIERSLRYDYDDYGTAQPNAPKKLTTNASWPEAVPTEDSPLAATIPFNQLHTTLAQKQPFPTNFPSRDLSPDLTASGTASTIPEPPCHHATLNARRITVKLAAPAPQARTFAAILISERSLDSSPLSSTSQLVTFVIQAGESESDPFDLVPEFTTGGTFNESHEETVELSLVPIEVKEAWSDQIPDVTVNGLPDKTGANDKPYIFMGARGDKKAYGRLVLASPVPEKFRQRLLVRFHRDEIPVFGPVPGSSQIAEDGRTVRFSLNTVANQENKDYTVAIGFDDDSDANLSVTEVKALPEATYDGVNSIPLTYKIVGKDRYNQSRVELMEWTNNQISQVAFSETSRIYKMFYVGNVSAPATSVQASLGRLETIHPVGAKYIPASDQAETVELQFDTSTVLAQKIVGSGEFRSWFGARLREKENEVTAKFATFGDDPYPVDFTFSWTFPASSLAFAKLTSPDLFFSLHNVKLTQVSAQVTVHRSGQVQNVVLDVDVEDVFDFDHDNTFDILELPMIAAEVQAGFPTLGLGGRVFRERILLRGVNPWQNPNSTPFEYF